MLLYIQRVYCTYPIASKCKKNHVTDGVLFKIFFVDMCICACTNVATIAHNLVPNTAEVATFVFQHS